VSCENVQVGFWPCDPKVPDLPKPADMAAVALLGDHTQTLK